MLSLDYIIIIISIKIITMLLKLLSIYLFMYLNSFENIKLYFDLLFICTDSPSDDLAFCYKTLILTHSPAYAVVLMCVIISMPTISCLCVCTATYLRKYPMLLHLFLICYHCNLLCVCKICILLYCCTVFKGESGYLLLLKIKM